ncbi:hypothetical protein SKAU_G00209930 [Synaphobranchus kaupii]|uniref:Uncharacterized protein n=1 Tax=Synaphobranchus kaupii TaxID=118154 RepID=A0A9Q1F8N1_SYNKA|nr:hypothetical protein SKAU_G00209930 [Synaphobranchus kaupii]
MLAPQLPSPASLIGPTLTAIGLEAEMLIPPAGFRGGLLAEKLTPSAGLSGPAPTASGLANPTRRRILGLTRGSHTAGGLGPCGGSGASSARVRCRSACTTPQRRVFQLVASGAWLVASGALPPLEH